MPSSTPLPTPAGAGIVTPAFEFQLDVPLENLEPGEYLIAFDYEASQRNETATYQLVSWDAKKVGSSIILVSLQETNNQVSLIAGTGGRLWFKVEYPSGLLVVELPSFRTREFSFGPLCSGLLGSQFIGLEYFIFKCQDAASESYPNIYIVAIEDLTIVSALPNIEGMSLRWLESDTLEFFSSWNFNKQIFQYCITKPTSWQINCQENPYEVGTTSSKGDWVWVVPSGRDGQDPYRAMPLAILPRECMGVESENCQPIQISRPSVWLDEEPVDFTYPAWSPNGEKLAVLDVACVGGPSDTWIWYYDLQSGVSQELIQLDDCYKFPFNSAIWSPDGQRFAVNGSPAFDQPLIISLEGSPMSYPLPVKGWVVGTIQIP